MSDYSISMNVNNIAIVIVPYVKFADLFESFLKTIEQANTNKHPIDNACMTFKDRIIATDIQAIIRIGTVIAGFDIMITSARTGHCIMNHPYDIMFANKNNFTNIESDVKVSIVGSRQQIYSVLQSPVLAQNLRTYFTVWENVSNDALKIMQDCQINPVLQEPIDMNWTMEYYAPAELKKALALIDTNPEESKKILMVMDYMLSNGKR